MLHFYDTKLTFVNKCHSRGDVETMKHIIIPHYFKLAVVESSDRFETEEILNINILFK